MFGTPPLLPKLKCHIGNLRDTNGDMGPLDRSVEAAFPGSLLFVSFPVLAYCFVGRLLRCSYRARITLLGLSLKPPERQAAAQQVIRVSYRL